MKKTLFIANLTLIIAMLFSGCSLEKREKYHTSRLKVIEKKENENIKKLGGNPKGVTGSGKGVTADYKAILGSTIYKGNLPLSLLNFS